MLHRAQDIKGLAKQDAIASHHGKDLLRQFVKLCVSAWFRPHLMHYRFDTVSMSL